MENSTQKNPPTEDEEAYNQYEEVQNEVLDGRGGQPDGADVLEPDTTGTAGRHLRYFATPADLSSRKTRPNTQTQSVRGKVRDNKKALRGGSATRRGPAPPPPEWPGQSKEQREEQLRKWHGGRNGQRIDELSGFKELQEARNALKEQNLEDLVDLPDGFVETEDGQIVNANGRVKGRVLIPWHNARMFEKLMFCLIYELHRRGNEIPWDRATHRLFPGSSGHSAQQYLMKLRDQLISEGHFVAPTYGKVSVVNDENIRGFQRDWSSPDPTATVPIIWGEEYIHPATSIQNDGIIKGSGNYRKGTKGHSLAKEVAAAKRATGITRRNRQVTSAKAQNPKPRPQKQSKAEDAELSDDDPEFVAPVPKRKRYDRAAKRDPTPVAKFEDAIEDTGLIDDESVVSEYNPENDEPSVKKPKLSVSTALGTHGSSLVVGPVRSPTTRVNTPVRTSSMAYTPATNGSSTYGNHTSPLTDITTPGDFSAFGTPIDGHGMTSRQNRTPFHTPGDVIPSPIPQSYMSSDYGNTAFDYGAFQQQDMSMAKGFSAPSQARSMNGTFPSAAGRSFTNNYRNNVPQRYADGSLVGGSQNTMAQTSSFADPFGSSTSYGGGSFGAMAFNNPGKQSTMLSQAGLNNTGYLRSFPVQNSGFQGFQGFQQQNTFPQMSNNVSSARPFLPGYVAPQQGNRAQNGSYGAVVANNAMTRQNNAVNVQTTVATSSVQGRSTPAQQQTTIPLAVSQVASPWGHPLLRNSPERHSLSPALPANDTQTPVAGSSYPFKNRDDEYDQWKPKEWLE